MMPCWPIASAMALTDCLFGALMSIVFRTGFVAAALLASSAMAQGIYTCVDAKGRKITSDRPIADCIDRTQQEMSPQGTVRRVLGPTLTAQERAAQDEKDKVALEQHLHALEEKRRDRALLARYPNRALHDKERNQAFAQIDEVVKAAAKRSVELAEQRAVINAEFEFYKKDISKAPTALKRRVDDNDIGIAIQQRFISDQDLEKRRVNQRFDEELAKLKTLWAIAQAPVGNPRKLAGTP